MKFYFVNVVMLHQRKFSYVTLTGLLYQNYVNRITLQYSNGTTLHWWIYAIKCMLCLQIYLMLCEQNYITSVKLHGINGITLHYINRIALHYVNGILLCYINGIMVQY